MTLQVIQIPSEKMDSNSYLIEEGGHVIIVDGSSFEGILEAVREHGWTVDYLVLTHEHFDHIWFLEQLREELSMPVIACSLCSERIRDVKANLSNISDVLYYFKTGIVREGKSPSFTCRAADITFEDSCEMDWQGHHLRMQRLPGHSPASTVVWLDESHVFSGDYLILEEKEITRLKGGSTEDYEAIARPVLERIPEGTCICPGHGPMYEKGQQDE
ncbi:MAG: MBL fold metallo-hydrolase [Firmicutes bacterium]|nr:MBL fold metallo-hydrolase [Bacillota bacterium]